jgi:heparan-alpha-glucosaminide N-acetyltransferase
MSVDIFRGLTILVMIFVNDLGEVHGLPWWTYHMPKQINGMTYVDMVFPFFLFIVGISLPLAIRRRTSQGGSEASLWLHTLGRSASLIALGVALANSGKVNAQLTHLNESAWTLIFLIGAVLFWNIYPRSEKYKNLFVALKYLGLLMMATMFAIFRRETKDGSTAWLDISYWEILGLIGWTYLGVCILYLPTRKWRWAPLAWFVALTLLNIASLAHWVGFTEKLPFYLWPFNTGIFALMTMAGIVISNVFLDESFSITRRQKAVWALCFAAILFLAGWLLTPLGISKIRATPTWGLYSAAAATLCFLGLYWICDVLKQVRWAAIVRPAGSNTLLTYLLPDLFYAAFGGIAFLGRWNHGWPGVVKSIVFTFLMLGLSAILTRCRVRLQL